MVFSVTTTTYAYDYANRITQATIAGVSTTYGYDTQGNRVFQITGNTETVYPSKFYSVTLNTSGATTTGTTTEYAYAGDHLLATIDQPIVNGTATGTGPIISYIHPDNLGSTNAVSDSSGNLSQSFTYAPFGSVLANTTNGSTTISRQFEGLFNDTSTNLVYSNARYLNPAQGQFLTEDPVFLALGDRGRVEDIAQQRQTDLLSDPQQLNPYSYARNNPITKEDPTGKLGADTVVEGLILGSLIYGGIDTFRTGFSYYLERYSSYSSAYSDEERSEAQTQFGKSAVKMILPKWLAGNPLGEITDAGIIEGTDLIAEHLQPFPSTISHGNDTTIQYFNANVVVNNTSFFAQSASTAIAHPSAGGSSSINQAVSALNNVSGAINSGALSGASLQQAQAAQTQLVRTINPNFGKF